MIEFHCPTCNPNAAHSHRAFLCYACRTFATASTHPLDVSHQAMAKDEDEDDAPKGKKPEKAKGGVSMGLILGIVGVLLVCCICLPAGGGVVFFIFFTGVGGAAQRVQTVNNMRELGMALHSSYDVNKQLPAPRAFKGDLSWRVTVLPYIEQDVLFRQFDMNKAWDQPPNQQILTQRPRTYQSPLHPAADASSTPFQYFTGPNSLFPQSTTVVRFEQIKDGTSNTILFSESKSPVPWSKPADMSTVGALMVPVDRYVVCMADGSVKVVNPARILEADVRGMIHPDDGKFMPLGLE